MSKKCLLIIVLLLFVILLPTESQAYWGLRNINMNLPDSIYNGLKAADYAFSVSWARTEPEDDDYNWNNLDNVLDFMQDHGGNLILLFQVQSPWATEGESRAPDDIDRRTPLSDEPPERGYSDALYSFVYRVVDRSIYRYRNSQYYRFGPEPQYGWDVTDSTYERDVDDYIRCLRTAYIAAHDAGNDNPRNVYLSHGGFYYNTQLEREWYLLGEENEELQDSLITLLQSRYERHAIRINDWQDLANRVNPRGRGMPPTYWQDAIAGQTEYLDWFDVHYHFKPRFIFDELAAFEHVVEDSGGELRPWLAAEAAMQLAEGSLTDYEERFHAGDMARKWLLGKILGLRPICTPIVGFPPEHFYGLFDNELNEYSASEVYRALKTIERHFDWGVDEPEIIRDDNIIIYRDPNLFGMDMPLWVIDYIWLDALEDGNEDTIWYTPPVPRAERYEVYFDTVLQVDIFGDTLRELSLEGSDSIVVTQEPTIIIWYAWGSGVDENNNHVPTLFYINSVYPNPFNSEFRIDYDLRVRGDVNVNLYSLDGRIVGEYEYGELSPGAHTATIDAAGLPAGVYLLRIGSGEAVYSRKIVHLK